MRWPLRLLKYGLALLGAYLLVALYIDRWGGPAAIWFLVAPLAYGLIRGFRASRPSSPAPR